MINTFYNDSETKKVLNVETGEVLFLKTYKNR